MIRRSTGILILFLLTCRFSASAQHEDKTGEPRVDTTVGDTIVVGAEPSVENTHLDTSYLVTPELQRAVSSDETPVLRSVPDTTVAHWQQDPRFAYANDPDYWKRKPRPRPDDFNIRLARFLTSDGFRYTVLTLLSCLLLYAIIRIVTENNFGMFARRKTKAKGVAEAEQELPPEESVEERLRYYLQTGERRQATRYLYLKALRLLDERNLIRWHAESTNQEYLRQLQGNTAEPAFRFLTQAYEMVWYGDFVINEANFQRLHEHFTQFFKTLQA
ncbi:MAG TPA: DUF4129 domain-containing protein [Puia sp.]|jgi:hypothetical protein|nr:DUF4129 domain-containing protein [Puia sp.]